MNRNLTEHPLLNYKMKVCLESLDKHLSDKTYGDYEVESVEVHFTVNLKNCGKVRAIAILDGKELADYYGKIYPSIEKKDG